MNKHASLIPFTPDTVMYHANCADGFGAVWTLYQLYGDDVKYMPVDYNKPPEMHHFINKNILMVDVSFPRDVIEQQIQASAQFFLLDHHATAARQLHGLSEKYDHCDIVLDMDRSGARLAWDFAFPHLDPPLLLSVVEARDLWRFNVEHSHDILAALDVLPRTIQHWNAFNDRLHNELEKVIYEGRVLQEQFNSQLLQIAKNAHHIQHGEYQGWSVNAPYMFASHLGSDLSSKEDADFGLVWILEPGNIVRCSWRTTNANKVSAQELAEDFGGGGHRNSSGARIALKDFLKYLSGQWERPSPTKKNTIC